MPNSYFSLFLHVIFSTKKSKPLIDKEIQPRLFAFIGGIVRRNRSSLLAAGGMPDHVHLLILWHPGKSLPDFMREVKASSSRWIHETFERHADFHWQDGYAAFSVSRSNTAAVKQYIDNQETHHKTRSFEEEFLDFLKKHDVAYDSRFLEV